MRFCRDGVWRGNRWAQWWEVYHGEREFIAARNAARPEYTRAEEDVEPVSKARRGDAGAVTRRTSRPRVRR